MCDPYRSDTYPLPPHTGSTFLQVGAVRFRVSASAYLRLTLRRVLPHAISPRFLDAATGYARQV